MDTSTSSPATPRDAPTTPSVENIKLVHQERRQERARVRAQATPLRVIRLAPMLSLTQP